MDQTIHAAIVPDAAGPAGDGAGSIPTKPARLIGTNRINRRLEIIRACDRGPCLVKTIYCPRASASVAAIDIDHIARGAT